MPSRRVFSSSSGSSELSVKSFWPMDSPSLSGKRKVSSISPNSIKFSPEKKRTREEEFCEVSENDEVLTALDMAKDLATKMDLALFKLNKLETIDPSPKWRPKIQIP